MGARKVVIAYYWLLGTPNAEDNTFSWKENTDLKKSKDLDPIDKERIIMSRVRIELFSLWFETWKYERTWTLNMNNYNYDEHEMYESKIKLNHGIVLNVSHVL